MKSLKELFDENNCDKGSLKHRYDRCYESYMRRKRYDPINLLEIGCFRGESTKSWFEYFPNGNIYTIDIFERVKEKDIEILKEDRVHSLNFDSMSPLLPSAIRNVWDEIEFDFIIDDGAHWPNANRLTFKNCFQFLKADGSYFIEDVWMLNEIKSHPWIDKKPELYNIKDHNKFMETVENYKVKHYDYRESKGFKNNPDSYILRIKK